MNMFQVFSKKRIALQLLTLALTGTATAAAPLEPKTENLQCADSRVELHADCFLYAGHMLACTRQSLRFASADGKTLGTRVFKPQPIEEGDDYPVIEEKVGSMSCVETKDKQKLVVASMFNGGNCAQCEWTDVYTTDGKQVGSTRERKDRSAALTAAMEAVKDKQVNRVLNQKQLRAFYQVPAGK
jgi:hypothetical protein